jgi:hypothetical protein
VVECLDQIAGSPRTARGLNQRLSRRLREADDRIVKVEIRGGRARGSWRDADSQSAESSANSSYLAAKNPCLQHQFCSPLGLGDRPFIVGRRPTAGEGLPPWQPDLELNDAAPFRLSRNHFAIEKHDGGYRVRDLCSTLGTIVNGEPIGQYVPADASTPWGHLASDAPLRAGENEVIAGGANSPFVFSVFITSRPGGDMAGEYCCDLYRVDKNTDWQICIADRPQMTPRKVTDYRLPLGRSKFQNRINGTNQLEQNRIDGANKLEGNRQSYRNNAWRLLIVLALSVLTGGCGIAVGQDVRAYDACLSRHPHDTVVCEGPRQAYELEPSVVPQRSVASRPAASYDH